MRFRLTLLAFLAAVAVSLPASAANRTAFQLQADGVFASPTGTLPSAQGAKLSSVIGSGSGFAVTGSLGLTRRFFGAVRVESFHHREKTSSFRFNDLPDLPGPVILAGSGPYEMRRDLEGVTVHALLQYRRVMKTHVGWFVEAGGGVTSFGEKLKLVAATGELLDIKGYQREPSYSLGGGLSIPVPYNFDLVAGARYDGATSGDGAIWVSGDNPRFVTGSLGLRYPRVTH